MEKRNLAKLVVIGVSLAVCTGAAFWDTGGETKALEVAQRAVTPVTTLVQVYISGEIVHPGIYQVPKGARAHEVIKLAGGLTAGADKERVNLARICKDGTHINVPALSRSKLKRRQQEESQEQPEQYVTKSKKRGVQKQVRQRRPASKHSGKHQQKNTGAADSHGGKP